MMHRIVIPTILSTMLLATFAAGASAEERMPPGDGPVKTFEGEDRAHAFGEIDEATRRFRDMSRDYDNEMKALVLREVRTRRQFIERSYGKRIEDVDVVQRQRRLEAIAALERFISRYPNHGEHTPDAMVRLAELYFEKAQVDHDVQMASYERDLDLFERGKIPQEPDSPRNDFSESTKLYDEVIRRFRDYRYRDVCYYMKGYTQYQSGLEREARDSWLAGATKHPKGKYASEEWLRVGEYHFDYGEWKLAEKAYQAASEYKDSRFYEMILYKLAWTWFQQYKYDDAINGFITLISHYDARTTESALGSALREEAVQYLARSLAEDDWNGDGERDEAAGTARAFVYLNKGKPYEREILLEYAKSLYDLHEGSKYAEAAQVYRKVIDFDPNHADNPELHERLIETFELAQDMAAVTAEQDQLVKRYARGTPWYKANMANAKATSRADKLVEAALRKGGKFHHVAAQDLKVRAGTEENPALLDAAKAEYNKAVESYRQYLAAYPHRRESEEIRFLLAEALYYSVRYLEAATAYAAVRDRESAGDYREPAGFSAIKSVEMEMERLSERGKLPAKALARDAEEPPEAQQTDKKGTKITRVKPQKLPDVVGPWVEHTDKYRALGFVHEDDKEFTVQQAYRVALMYYNYRHYPEARKRFEEIISKYSLSKEAGYAAFVIINSYKDENDWANIEKWIARTTELLPPEKGKEIADQLKSFKLGQQFDRAMALLDEKQFVPAAEEFERVVNQNSGSKFADKALFNAAIAFQQGKRYNSAARVFERIVTEPQFKGTKFREDALFFMAENNRRFFSFEKAVMAYLALLKSYPKSERNYYALDWSAQLEDMQGNYDKAAAHYERYARDFSDRDEAPLKMFQAALVFEKMNDSRGQIRVLKEFIKRYKDNPLVSGKIVEANLRLGVLHQKTSTWRAAKKFFERTIDEFESRGLQPQTSAAKFASQARFTLIDVAFRKYEKLVLKGSLANQGRIIQAKRKTLGELQTQYESIVPYKSFDWSVAAFFRIGQLYQLFAQMLYDAPDPPGLGDEEMDDYRTMVEDEGLKWENVAIERYEVAVKAARGLKIVNKWSQLSLKALNKYKPAEYPLFKSEKRAYDMRPVSDVPLVPRAEPKADPTPEADGGGGAAEEPKVPMGDSELIEPETEGGTAPEPEPEPEVPDVPVPGAGGAE